jgi:rhamnosyltransferase
MSFTVDVIIPVYHSNDDFKVLLEMLSKQTYKVNEIKVILTIDENDSAEDVKEICENYANIVLTEISKKDFNHGSTRRKAAAQSNADVFVMMTQDAIPVGDDLIEKLLAALNDDKIGAAYARQLPKDNADELERYWRLSSYPKESSVKSMKDAKRLGIKAFFMSDVCAAYKKSAYLEAGGFLEGLSFNEDMMMAYALMQKDYSIKYEAQALVRHSHNFKPKDYFKRYRMIGASQRQHPGVFKELPVSSEGARFFGDAAKYLLKNKKPHLLGKLFAESVYKYAGFTIGKYLPPAP